MAAYHDRDRKLNYRVNGSAAYDVRKPQRTRVILPEEQYAPQNQHIRTRAQISPVTVLGIAVLAFLAVLIVFVQVRIFETEMEIASLETQITELEETHGRLEGIYESQKDMLSLNRHAEEMGMHRITQAEIVYLDLCGADHAAVTPAERSNVFLTVFTALKSSIREFVEYLS